MLRTNYCLAGVYGISFSLSYWIEDKDCIFSNIKNRENERQKRVVDKLEIDGKNISNYLVGKIVVRI